MSTPFKTYLILPAHASEVTFVVLVDVFFVVVVVVGVFVVVFVVIVVINFVVVDDVVVFVVVVVVVVVVVRPKVPKGLFLKSLRPMTKLTKFEPGR